MSIADDVKHQLSADYPERTLGWIKDAQWSGPQEIPLTAVDMTHRRRWNAWKEPQRVAKMETKITRRTEQGRRIKPVVLVDVPDSSDGKQLKVVDGHHRTLAYRNINKPVWSYVGKVSKTEGPWDELHAQQYNDDERPTTDEYGADLTAKMDVTTHDPHGSQEPNGPQQHTWLAWEHDRQLAQQLADRLQHALVDAVDTRSIAEQWTDMLATQAPGPGAAESYVLSLAPQVRDALEAVLGPAWQEAWELGHRSAQQQVQEGNKTPT